MQLFFILLFLKDARMRFNMLHIEKILRRHETYVNMLE